MNLAKDLSFLKGVQKFLAADLPADRGMWGRLRHGAYSVSNTQIVTRSAAIFLSSGMLQSDLSSVQ